MKKDITFLIPSMNGGGAEKVTLLLANELSSRGWEVTLLLARVEGPYLKRISNTVKIVSLKHVNISKNVLIIAQFLKATQPSVFYISMMYVNVIAGFSAAIAGYKGKLFFSEHTHASNNLINNKGFITKLTLSLAKSIYKRADKVICVSEDIKADLLTHINVPKSTIVLYNPVEDLGRSNVKTDGNIYRIISVGRLDKNKNFQLLINAFALVFQKLGKQPNLELNILGEGIVRNDLETLIKKLGLSRNVFLPGFIVDLGLRLNAADLFVLPSNIEGFGNVLVEALSCGLPVISTDCPCGPSEILINGKIGKLVPVDDLAALANAIVEEITNPNQISTKEARINRAKDFSVKKIVDQYEALFLK